MASLAPIGDIWCVSIVEPWVGMVELIILFVLEQWVWDQVFELDWFFWKAPTDKPWPRAKP